jgi:hypothetical protein
MLQDMQLRNLSEGTQRSYIHYVADYAMYYKKSPELLGLGDPERENSLGLRMWLLEHGANTALTV